MVRISDILKQKGQFPEPDPDRKKKEEGPASLPPAQELPAKKDPGYKERPFKEAPREDPGAGEAAQIGKAMSGAGGHAEKEMQVAKAMHHMHLDSEESMKIYRHAQEAIKDILAKNQKAPHAPLDLKGAYDVVKAIVDRMVMGDKELIALTVGYSQDNYLYAHMTNVSILSIDVGLGLGYNKSKLNELGMGAFLHDIGMNRMMGIVQQPRKLSASELEEIKKHPDYGSNTLKGIKDIEDGIIYVAKQEHERLNGTGYPQGLKDDEIHEFAKIVAIIDVYEALIHPRSHRDAISPHEAIKELLSVNNVMLFEARILKLLINRIGLYPVGCWVELNTGEIAKVISSNEDSPLRPRVNVIFNPAREKLSQVKLVDLSRNTNLYVKRGINPQESDLKFE